MIVVIVYLYMSMFDFCHNLQEEQSIFASVQNTTSSFSALTLLVGRQEEHPDCKKLGVGLLVVII